MTMLPWKPAAKKYKRLLDAELSGSRKLYLALVEQTRRRIEAGRRMHVEPWEGVFGDLVKGGTT